MDKNEKKQMNMIYKLEKPEYQQTAIRNVAEILLDSEMARNGFKMARSGMLRATQGMFVLQNINTDRKFKLKKQDKSFVYDK